MKFTTCRSGIDTKLYLLNNTGSILQSADNGSDLTMGCGSTSQEADISYYFDTAGDYYLLAEGNGNIRTFFGAHGGAGLDCFDYYEGLGMRKSFEEVDLLETEMDHVKIYPNPTSGNFTVERPIEETDNLLIQISTVQGKLVREVYSRQSHTVVEVSNLSNGLYIINLSC